MKHTHDVLATLQQLRGEAESLARHQHLTAAHERRLQQTRERVSDLHPGNVSPHVQQAYELALQRAEIEQIYLTRRQASGVSPDVIDAVKQQQLSELPELPELSLQEQETLLQALMCQAVVQYVDTAIAQHSAA